MKKSIKSIMLIIVIGLLLINSLTNISYAQSAEDELKQVLTEYKDQLGNLKQFKEVVDEAYGILDNATEVTPELKEDLITALRKLQNVEGINPLISSVLVQELEGQANILTNENLAEMRSEIRVIKEWVDEEIEKEESNPPTGDGDSQQPTNPPAEDDNSQQPTNPPVDDENKGNGEINNKPNQNSGNTQKDPTQSGNKLPNTGKTSIITIAIVLVVIAIISVSKYKRLKDIK